MVSIRNSIVSTYRKLTHKNLSYNRVDAFKEAQKIDDLLTYGSLKKLADMTPDDITNKRLKIFKEEQKILNDVLPEAHSIRAYKKRIEGPIFDLWFNIRYKSASKLEALKSVKEQTESELKRFGFTYCDGYSHPKLEEIGILSAAVAKRNKIDNICYAILARTKKQIVDLNINAEKGHDNIDGELSRIRKDFEKNIKLFESGLIDDSDKELQRLFLFN